VTVWSFRHRELMVEMQATDLQLGWEVHGEREVDVPIADTPPAEAWSIWRRSNPADVLPITWMITWQENGPELAPFQEDPFGLGNFLTHYTYPVDEEGERVSWLELPVRDHYWDDVHMESHPEARSFIQAHSGWKPSPFQPAMEVDRIERIMRGEYRSA
jgi:hypothetical protein